MNDFSRFLLAHDEEVKLVVRAHWLTEVLPLIIITLLFLLPFFLMWPLFSLGLPGATIFFVLAALAVYFAISEFRRWRKTVLILTTKRLFFIQQKKLFDQVVTELSYRNIQDISYRLKGFWSNIGNFGTLRFQVAGGSQPLEIAYLPRPSELQHLVHELRGWQNNDEASQDNEWWEERIANMTREERRIFFEKIKSQLGEGQWRDLFRP